MREKIPPKNPLSACSKLWAPQAKICENSGFGSKESLRENALLVPKKNEKCAPAAHIFSFFFAPGRLRRPHFLLRGPAAPAFLPRGACGALIFCFGGLRRLHFLLRGACGAQKGPDSDSERNAKLFGPEGGVLLIPVAAGPRGGGSY